MSDKSSESDMDTGSVVVFVPPDHFLCPITFEVMKDPVICADGNTYERSEITKWLAKHNTSPKTKDILPNKTLIPNKALKAAIDKMNADNPDWEIVEVEELEKRAKKEVSKSSLQIFIKTISNHVYTLDVDKKNTIGDIKRMIFNKEGLKPHQQRLIYGGKMLDDNKTLHDYSIANHGTLYLVLRCLGGCGTTK